MAFVSRTSQFDTVRQVLMRHYNGVSPEVERPVLEHLLFACCLEDAHYEAAEEAFAALVHTFFDWNEVRVTSIAELSEVTGGLPDPRAAANRLKRVLHGVFEATYSFDLEEQRKKNLGPTVKWLKKIDGTTNFSVAYVVQSALGGHAIPVDSGVLKALRIVELVSDKDVEAGVVPGLERAVSKAKGTEFGSMLHQLGADFTANPYSPSVRKILLQINPDVEDQLPRRRARKAAGKRQSAKLADQTSQDKTASPDDKKTAPPAKRKPAATEKKTSSSQQKKKSGELSKRKPR